MHLDFIKRDKRIYKLNKYIFFILLLIKQTVLDDRDRNEKRNLSKQIIFVFYYNAP